MLYNTKATNRIVLIFTACGLLSLIIFISLILINNKTFVDKTYYRTVLNNAKGLNAKPGIYFKGLQIGQINGFKLNHSSNYIDVDFFVYGEFKDKIVKYSVLSGNQNVLFVDDLKFELLLPSNHKSTPLPENSLVPYIASQEAISYIKQGLIEDPGTNLDSILANVNTILINLQREDNPEAGALFRLLDRTAKISERFFKFSQQLEQTNIIPKTEQTLSAAHKLIEQAPQTLIEVNKLIHNMNDLLKEIDSVIKTYDKPAELINHVTANKIPLIMDNTNANLLLLKKMLSAIHAERLELVITVNSMQSVLNKLDKTLQGINNNPLIKPGIEKQQKLGIEMHD